MNKNYIKLKDAKGEFKKFSILSSDNEQDSIYMENGIFTMNFANKDASKYIPIAIPAIEEIMFNTNNRIKHVYVGLTTDAETIVNTLNQLLRIQIKNKNTFDITLLEDCEKIIKHTDFFAKNSNRFILVGSEVSNSQKELDLYKVLSNIAVSEEIPEIELKIYIHLFGKYVKLFDMQNHITPAISYSNLISTFEISTNLEKKIIVKSIDRLEKRGLVILKPIEKKGDLRLIRLNFRGELNFGVLK